MATTTGRLVDLRVRGGIAWLQLANPPLNSCTYEMMRDLDDAILHARFDDAVHVLVIRGAGEEVFCAGADANMLNAVGATFRDQFFLHAEETLRRLERTPKLVIAAINGHAWGAGLSIALAADLRVALANTALAEEERATLGLPDVALGLLPGMGGVGRLVRLAGESCALELMVSGKKVPLGRAVDLRLVNQVWECRGGEEFDARLQSFAESFCPPNAAPAAIGFIKRAARCGLEAGSESAEAMEHGLLQRLFETGDAREGLRAFLAGRKPSFTGE